MKILPYGCPVQNEQLTSVGNICMAGTSLLHNRTFNIMADTLVVTTVPYQCADMYSYESCMIYAVRK